MKILYCTKCGSLIKLTRSELRKCKCEKVQGRYITKTQAFVTQNSHTISIAIGNGSLKKAIKKMHWLETHDPLATREDYQKVSSLIAWVRPNTGDGNPRSHRLRVKKKS